MKLGKSEFVSHCAPISVYEKNRIKSAIKPSLFAGHDVGVWSSIDDLFLRQRLRNILQFLDFFCIYLPPISPNQM